MSMFCVTRLFLNSWHPGSLWHSKANFHYLWMWLFSDMLASPSQWWFLTYTYIIQLRLNDWMPIPATLLTHTSFSPCWNGTACSCNWETKDWVPKYCSLWLHYHLLRVQVFPGSNKLPVSHIWAIASSEDGKHEGPFAGLLPLFPKKYR